MKMEFIKMGDIISTEEGYVEITGRHYEDFIVNEYGIDEEGAPVLATEGALLTRHDLNARAKDADGRNHNFWWEDSEDE